MKINELIAEQQHLDELSLSDVGRGVGKVVRGVSKGVGAVAGGIAGIPSAVKQGFQAGKEVVGGKSAQTAPLQPTPQSTPSTKASKPVNPSSTTPSPTNVPASSATSGQTSGSSVGTRVGAGQAKQEVDDAVAAVKNVRSRDRQKVVQYAKDQIDAISAQPATSNSTAQSGTSSMSQMATQMANQPTKSSTGGTTTGVSGTVKHQANPNNPNAQQAVPEDTDRIIHLNNLLRSMK